VQLEGPCRESNPATAHVPPDEGRDQTVFTTCNVGPVAPKADMFACLASHGYRQVDLYQPVSRFWAFQGIESAIVIGLTLALLTITFCWVTRRSTS
jgi:hypothetical protein